MDNIEQDERTELEQQLRASLRHVPAPDGFTDRVMDRVRERASARSRASRSHSLAAFASAHKRAGWGTAIAATLLFALGGDMLHVHNVRQAQRQEQAQQQLDMAMQLTSRALGEVDNSLDRTPAVRFTQIALQLAK